MIGLSLMKAANSFKTFLIAANGINLNLFSIAGSPTSKGKFRFVINAGVIVGHTTAAVAAIAVGQFPAGSEIELINYGSIQGRGGLGGSNGAVGSNGGDCVKADYLNQTVRVFNFGQVMAGGGGGGAGGAGGKGGDGGRGNITSTSAWTFFQQGGGGTEWVDHYNTGIVDALWYPQSFRGGSFNPLIGLNMLAPIGILERGDYIQSGDDNNGLGPYNLHYVRLNTLQAGGVGGATRVGGIGGNGAGYNQVRSLGQTGEQSTPGTDPGNGAGKAGQSGNAGLGGDGGDWAGSGTVGNAGNVGWDGNAGTAGGFNESGALGAPGIDPAAAGIAGRAFIISTASVTVVNTGTVVGATI